MRYVVVTAARDEAAYLETTIRSLTAHTIKPVRWIIVNDGSTDETGQLGWVSQKFEDEKLKVFHLRPTGSTQHGIYTGRRRRGAGMHFMGAHPIWVLASAFRRILEPPIALGTLCILCGYFLAWCRGAGQVEDPDLIRFTRQWQIKKILALLRLRRAPFNQSTLPGLVAFSRVLSILSGSIL